MAALLKHQTILSQWCIQDLREVLIQSHTKPPGIKPRTSCFSCRCSGHWAPPPHRDNKYYVDKDTNTVPITSNISCHLATELAVVHELRRCKLHAKYTTVNSLITFLKSLVLAQYSYLCQHNIYNNIYTNIYYPCHQLIILQLWSNIRVDL